MKVSINNKELELRYSMRIYIIYEAMMDKSIEPQDFDKTTNVITLLYATILATMQYNRESEKLSWDDFMDWVDEQGPQILFDFATWFSKTVEAQKSAEPVLEQSKKQKGIKKKSNA